ncbi:MAG: metallophosphoesterase [Bacteroidales bacterium]|nr:MAG: metallophosphoesterase [Bacteroidales bacterium]
MRIAITSDIHGNSWALEAVLSDIGQKGITSIYDLGDSLYGPLDPKGTFDLISKNNIISLCGNQDRNIVENQHGNGNQTLGFVLQELNADAINWLTELPKIRRINDSIILFHGTPANDMEYLVEQLNPGYVGIKGTHTLDGILKGIAEHIVFCGHSHSPRVVKTEKKLIINPGSVGLPAYDDELPIPHRMENFSPLARYCILDNTDNIKIEHIAVSYDFMKPANRAKKNNRPDWAKWIETGIA